MKKLFTNIGGKMAALADDIASYNDTNRQAAAAKPPGAGSGCVLGKTIGSGGIERPLDPVLEHLLRNVRSRHVRQHFARTPASEYTGHRSISIQVATFNVAGKRPPPGLRLDEWLGAGPAAGGTKFSWPTGTMEGEVATNLAATGGSSNGPDMLAVGFVELVPLNAGNVMGVWGNQHVDAWDRCLAVYLNGEEWAGQRYGSSAPGASSQAAAAAAAALLDSKWQGGGGGAGDLAYRGPSVIAGPVPSSSGGNPVTTAAASNSGSSEGEYVQVASKQLVGVYLSVWVRRRLLPQVRGVQVTTVATGFGGYLGNKGAVAARMRVFDSSLVFVASHLTAGEAEGDELRRNADVADILRRAVFVSGPDGGGAVTMTAAPAALISASLGPGHWDPAPATITDHDVVIWVGDLNYRIATVPTAASGASGPGGEQRPMGQGLTDADVRSAIRSGRLEPLQAADQLNRERAAGRVFQGWQEGRISFLPTYKFKAGTNTYNGDDPPSSSSTGSLAVSEAPPSTEEGEGVSVAGPSGTADPEKHKRRTPAWCDRVLWWTRPRITHQQQQGPGGDSKSSGGSVGPRIKQLSYWRGELTISDHKPVAAAFVADVVSYDRRRIVSILEAGMRAVDLMQQSLRPRVTVEPVLLDASEWVALARPVPLRLQITNTGSVEAIYHFVPPPNPLLHTDRSRGADQGAKFGLDDETPPLPAWLEAEPPEGVVQPGQSCEIVLTVLVEGGAGGAADQLSVPPTSPSSGSLDAILILRIEDSGDKFISIAGRYRRSFLGLSLEALSRLGTSPALPLSEAAVMAERLGQKMEGGDEWIPAATTATTTAVATAAAVGGAAATVTPPKEVMALISALMRDSAAALSVPGILADSPALVLARAGYELPTVEVVAAVAAGGEEAEVAEALQPTSREAQRALIRQLEPLRLILDAGHHVPHSADPHEVAALLMLWCGQLPYQLISAAVADAAAATPPATPAEAAALLRRHCGSLQLVVVSELLKLLRATLEPAMADRNGLTAGRLAAAAAAWWMPPLAAGAAADAASGQRAVLTMLLAAEATA